ncbi:MAG: DUF736 domain-containing protein [Acidobacteriia bacterium]|nr:DUF736 domain-containing protein [Terriglobia bacterium]
MAIIGKFTKDGAGFTGFIETLAFKAQITLEPNTTKKSDKSPDFRVMHIGEDFTSEIGAAWLKTAKKSGAEYVSLSIHDDPSLVAPINCRLVKTGSEQGHTLFWERPDERENARQAA